MNSKDYFINKVERSEEMNKELNKKIRTNIIFAVASFVLAGVAFGIGEQLFASTSIQNIVAFGSVGISCANIKALKNNLELRKSSKPKQYTKSGCDYRWILI